MLYTNIIYLKSGKSIEQGSNQNLAEQLRHEINWEKGTVFLDSNNQTAIPKKNIEFVDTKKNGEKPYDVYSSDDFLNSDRNGIRNRK